ncbi:MAG: 50S ribosomal protein L3 [Planctomycetota bacterium]
MGKRVLKSILGKKIGMSQIYDEDGTWIPVTLIQAGPCTVLQVKTEEPDGYSALQVGFDETKKRPRKPQEGLYKKLDTAATRFVKEVPAFHAEPLEAGAKFDLSVFDGVASVDVAGTSKGRGFSGTVRRWNHAIGPKSHGSKSKRNVGSTGMHQDPGRVIKGKKMPGQYGNERVKVRNLRVVSADPDQNLLVVKGAVPGPKNGYLIIQESL